jgi:hypothetical protein
MDMDVKEKAKSYLGDPPALREDEVTKTIERYTAAIPSSMYLGIGVAAMAVSLVAQLTGGGKWGNFVAQWVPTWLIIGLYNKVVKQEGHDIRDRARGSSHGEPSAQASFR